MAIDPNAVAGEILKAKPAGSEVLVRVRTTQAGHTRFARSEITSTGDVDGVTVTVEVAFGKRVAAADTNQVDAASLRTLVDRAARLAKLSPENPEKMPVLGPQKYVNAPAAFDGAAAKLEAPARAAAVEKCLAETAGKDVVAAGFYQHQAGKTYLATSAGLKATHADTEVSLTMTARTSDASGSGWGGSQSHRLAEIDATAIARTAVDKAVRSKGARKLDPGRYTVILEPAAVSGLLQFLIQSLDARRADEGRSFFSKAGGGTKVGEKIFPDFVTVRSDPADPASPSAPFDPEGMPRRAIGWIDKGTVAALRYTRYWADKQKQTPTGMPGNYHLLGGTATAADLLSGVKRGVLVTRFWYIRMVDPQSILATGLTRDGVFLVENGEIVAPVNNFRFNESPVQMLVNADAFTKETYRTDDGPRVPALRTHEFNLASISEAV